LTRYLQLDEDKQVIASPNLTTSLGRRNQAILLLLARLGLRGATFVQLRLGDLESRDDVELLACGKDTRSPTCHLPKRRYIGLVTARNFR
jgi:integrase/recombinase XerD